MHSISGSLKPILRGVSVSQNLGATNKKVWGRIFIKVILLRRSFRIVKIVSERVPI